MKNPEPIKNGQDLTALGNKVKELFDAGKTDLEIATDMKLTELQVLSIRGLMGLVRREWANVFQKFKKLGVDKNNEQFKVAFNIGHKEAEKIGLSWGDDYEYFATCSKGKIEMTIQRKVDD